MKIDKESFKAWKDQPITKEFFKMLQESLSLEKESLSSASLIMEANSDKMMARILGHTDVLDTLLHIDVEEIGDENEEA